MESNRKEIRFYGMKPSKPLLKMIERQVEKWAFRQTPLPLCPEASYRISIEREGKSCICCHLQVEAGPERWESVDVGRSAQEALFNAFQHLTRPRQIRWRKSYQSAHARRGVPENQISERAVSWQMKS